MSMDLKFVLGSCYCVISRLDTPLALASAYNYVFVSLSQCDTLVRVGRFH